MYANSIHKLKKKTSVSLCTYMCYKSVYFFCMSLYMTKHLFSDNVFRVVSEELSVRGTKAELRARVGRPQTS